MPAGFEPATPASLEQSGTITTSAGADLIALLPPGAADRLRALRQNAHDAHALIPDFSSRQAANTARGDAERRLHRLLAPRAEGGFALRENDPQTVQARQELARLTDEARRLAERYEERSEQRRSTSRVVQEVESWLRNAVPGGTTLQDYDGPTPTLNKGETITDVIERLRRRVRELRADLHRIRSAPYPSSYCKQQVKVMIEQAAARGAPAMSALVEHGRDEIGWPTQRITSHIFNAEPGAIGFAVVPDFLAVLAWALGEDALTKRLSVAIDAEADDSAALSHADRQKRESEVQQDLLAIEREEAALVWQAIEQGLPAEHRANCSPLATLQCALLTAPAAVNGRGTSPQHAVNIIGARR